ncbi:hypothetical protein [Thermococcus sp.]|uniref:hypothetical protein n=1 Tax=Thermococcus sp. TaxID=35749 RepID=UPI002619B2A3|nr:hypothetical protein [Thermococcus sp.]
MIGLVAVVVESLRLHDYPLIIGALVVFVLSLKSKDLGLVAYFIYALYSTQRVDVTSLYSYQSFTTALIFALAMLLLLEDVLRGKSEVESAELIPSLLLFLGVFVPESFIAGSLLYLAVRVFSPWGVLFGGVVACLLFLLRDTLMSLGAPGQVAVLSAVTLGVIGVLYLLKGPEKRPMFGANNRVQKL